MAKRKVKKKPARKAVTLSTKDKATLKNLRHLADKVVATAQRSRAPHLDIPSRSLSNVRFNRSRKIIEMGNRRNRRELFNLSQAKSYMQTMLVGSGCTSSSGVPLARSLRAAWANGRGSCDLFAAASGTSSARATPS